MGRQEAGLAGLARDKKKEDRYPSDLSQSGTLFFFFFISEGGKKWNYRGKRNGYKKIKGNVRTTNGKSN